MNGELAALLALCLHGNRWLTSGTEPAPALDTANSAFQYVEEVHATCPQRRFLRNRMWEAYGVAAWLRFVWSTGGRRLSLVAGDPQPYGLPGPVTASFANGGRWALIDDAPAPRVWHSHWAVRDSNRTDERIWTVQLTGSPLGQSRLAQPAPSSARDGLRSALNSIKGFAEPDPELGYWASWFTEALRLLDAPEPVIPYNPDLAPATFPLESRQLLAAAVKAWVFGGMGSWNDLGFADAGRQTEYEKRTNLLYHSVLAALVSATSRPISISE